MKQGFLLLGWAVGLIPFASVVVGAGENYGLLILCGSTSFAFGGVAGWIWVTDWRDAYSLQVAPSGKGKGWFPDGDEWPPKGPRPKSPNLGPTAEKNLEMASKKGAGE